MTDARLEGIFYANNTVEFISKPKTKTLEKLEIHGLIQVKYLQVLSGNTEVIKEIAQIVGGVSVNGLLKAVKAPAGTYTKGDLQTVVNDQPMCVGGKLGKYCKIPVVDQAVVNSLDTSSFSTQRYIGFLSCYFDQRFFKRKKRCLLWQSLQLLQIHYERVWEVFPKSERIINQH